MYICSQVYLECKDSVLHTVHSQNCHFASYMCICRQRSLCLLSDSSHSSYENPEVFIRPESSPAANTDVKTCLSENTEGGCNEKATWVTIWGTALQKTLLFGGLNFSGDTNTMLEGSNTDWLGDQFMSLPLCVLHVIQLRRMLWPPTLPDLCPINFVGTDILCESGLNYNPILPSLSSWNCRSL